MSNATKKGKRSAPAKVTAEALVLALRANGVDATDLRHCVHEASHALDARLRGKWTNDNVAAAMKRIGPGRAARSELLARAVEQIVCQRLGVATRPIEDWVGTSVIEAIKFGDPFLDYTTALANVKQRMETLEAMWQADKIIAFATRRPRRQSEAAHG